MPKSVPDYLKVKVASRACIAKILPKVGINLDDESDPECAKAVYSCISNKPTNLIRDCRIKTLGFEDLGPSAKYYPNHGYYRTPGDVLVLNKRMLSDPIHGVSDDGREISTFEFILAHELGHGWDAAQGQEVLGSDYSLCPQWTTLSDWSETPRPGHKRLRIIEKGYPEKVGEWYYGPEAKFSRYYGKMNPWDDWADSFAYYVTGMKNKLPKEKLNYFNDRLGTYFSDNNPYDLSRDEYAPGVDVYKTVFSSVYKTEDIEALVKENPEFMGALIRYTTYKELNRRGKSYDVSIPTLREYLHGYIDKDESIFTEYLGRVPKKEEGINKIIDEFLNKQKTSQEIKGETPQKKLLSRLFRRGPKMSSVNIKVAGTILDIADVLDKKGLYRDAATLRSLSKRVAADAKEIFKVNGVPIGVKSIEEFIEDFNPKTQDPFIEVLKAYMDYIDDIIKQHLDNFQDSQKKNKFKDIFEGVRNLAGMALKEFERPVPGRSFKDPTAPTQEELDKLISVADRMIKIKLKQLNIL